MTRPRLRSRSRSPFDCARAGATTPEASDSRQAAASVAARSAARRGKKVLVFIVSPLALVRELRTASGAVPASGVTAPGTENNRRGGGGKQKAGARAPRP